MLARLCSARFAALVSSLAIATCVQASLSVAMFLACDVVLCVDAVSPPEFRDNKNVTDPKRLAVMMETAERGVSQIQKYTLLEEHAHTWSVDMEDDPFGPPPESPPESPPTPEQPPRS
jgi:hypothetical protein